MKGMVTNLKYFDYFEKIQHGTFNYPIAHYHVTKDHPRYHMMHHWHIEQEIIIILSGKLELTLDGKEYTAEEGDIFFINDGVVHSAVPHDAVYESIVFDMRCLLSRNQVCNALVTNIIDHRDVIMPVMPHSEEIKSISERLVSAVSDEERGSELLVQGLITEFLGFIIKHKLFTDEKIADKRSTGQLVPFKRVVSYIEQNYAQKIMLADLAKTAGMTPKYFCSFFYGMTRKTPIEYVNNYRIERACEQLLSTEMSITDIGLNCGFNEISYFIKTFRKAIGTTPHQYRKKARTLLNE